MAAPPAELFALRLNPGEPISLDPDRDFVVTNICFAANEDDEAEEDEEFTPGETTIVKLHHIPADEPFGVDDSDDDSDDDDDFSDDGEEDIDDEDDEEEEEEEAASKANGSKADIEEGDDDEEDDDEEDSDEEDSDDDSDLPDVEEKIFSVARLTTGRIEQVTVNVQVCAEELVAFSLGGKKPRPVDLIGSYLAPQDEYNMEPDSDDEALLGSEDEGEEYSAAELKQLLEGDDDDDDEEDDEDFEEGDEDDSDPEMQEFSEDEDVIDINSIDHAELAALLAGEDVEDEEEDRFEEIGAGKKQQPAKISGKKRSADESADGDMSMADASSKSIDAPVTEAELARAAAAEGIDISTLNKNQRKRLNKKLKAQSGDAVPAPGAGEKKAEATPSKKDTPVKEKKAEANGKAAAAPVTLVPAATEKASASASAKAGSKKTTLASGLIIEEKKTGAGPQAKPGNKVQMRYIGRFKDGKIFDQNTKGAPFTFRLGKGEVIAGWDEGVKGMQAGSERRLTVPPKLGYGSKKTGPIPPNSTLYFDVKLVGIK